jgi:hypothetical protein
LDDLLARRDRLRLTMPELGPEATRALLAAVRERIGREPEVDHPSVRLEEFFLKVVQDARGADRPLPAAAIAPFLQAPR